MILADLNKDECSLLLYLETRAVDYGGTVNHTHINDADKEIIVKWVEQGFIAHNYIAFESMELLSDVNCVSVVKLSDEAYTLAHAERKARAERMAARKPYCELVLLEH